MRYIILGLFLIFFTACGSSEGSGVESGEEEPEEQMDKRTLLAPTPKDATKQPPAMPNI